MGNWHSQDSALIRQPGKRRPIVFQLQVDWLAQKQESAIPD
jgi:hypothetical protein